MNMQSDAIGALSQNLAAPMTISATTRFWYSVRRELWEHRSLYLAPLVIAGLFLLAYTVGEIHGGVHNVGITVGAQPLPQAGVDVPPGPHRAHFVGPYTFASYVLMGIFMIVSIFYSLDALYSERRDRSVLFWKSLPVSDSITVLAKASIPLILLPLFTFVLTVVTQWLMLLIDSASTLAHGESVAALWGNVHLFQMAGMLFFHLLAVHGLEMAPLYCWLLLVSAWARRAPLLWAALTPLSIILAEKIAFNTHYFSSLLKFLVGSGMDTVPFTEGGDMNMAALHAADVGQFFLNPGLWCGLVVAALMLAATIRVRRSREPI
jgi:ABC-2 type transport system permease protein